MLIYRGAGIMTLLMPIVTVLLLMWLWPDPSVKKGDVSLMQFLLGVGIGAAINTVMGLIINRKIMMTVFDTTSFIFPCSGLPWLWWWFAALLVLSNIEYSWPSDMMVYPPHFRHRINPMK
ncbi:hypothetical protein [Rahnella inusitata]|uniref:hypothetical protein n=1 Tax=Rahnella inusitata TaxID=58169 RepID=UPI001ABF1427|nr:hypothetical protein [Rahnella inusitata]